MLNDRAKQILLKGRKATKEEIKYAKSVGYWSDNEILTHDDGMILLNNIIPTLSKEKLVDNFLYSLSTRNLVYRSGLSAYANSFNMPVHGFPLTKNHICCEICLDHSYATERSINDIRIHMFALGGLLKRSVTSLYYNLEFTSKLPHQIPNENDINILKNIFRLINTVDKNISAPKLSQIIAKIKS